MNPLRLTVASRGKGYVAYSDLAEITAMGSTPTEAAENARLTATSAIPAPSRPTMLLVNVDEPGVSTIVLQPLDEPVSLDAFAEHQQWRYIASATKRTAAKDSP
jgi:hypothetical protein